MGSRDADRSCEPVSSDSDLRHVTGKRRCSRAGTRSVTTLTTVQLERKRANDREAQRAIRQRTKEHIDRLERRIADYAQTEKSNEQLAVSTQRIRDLEAEVDYLRNKLREVSSMAVETTGTMVFKP